MIGRYSGLFPATTVLLIILVPCLALAADSDGDGMVSVAELGTFAARRTRMIGEEIGFRQEPQVSRVGMDFPLYRLP